MPDRKYSNKYASKIKNLNDKLQEKKFFFLLNVPYSQPTQWFLKKSEINILKNNSKTQHQKETSDFK